jgi:hypothetical protein
LINNFFLPSVFYIGFYIGPGWRKIDIIGGLSSFIKGSTTAKSNYKKEEFWDFCCHDNLIKIIIE